MSDDNEPVTRICPHEGCAWEVTAPPSGPGSAGLKLGAHRATAHGYRNPASKAKRKTAAEASPAQPVALVAARAAAGEVSDRSTKAPTIDELTRAYARFLGTISVAAASAVAETDPVATTEADREAIVEYLAISPADAKEIAYPLARFTGRSKLNARYGRAVVDNVDAASAVVTLVDQGMRWRRYMRLRGEAIAHMSPRGPAPVAMPIIPGTAVPPPPAPSSAAAAAEMAGVVWTPDMVAQANGNGAVTHHA